MYKFQTSRRPDREGVEGGREWGGVSPFSADRGFGGVS